MFLTDKICRTLFLNIAFILLPNTKINLKLVNFLEILYLVSNVHFFYNLSMSKFSSFAY